MFADHGTEVVGVDIDPQIVNLLNTGTIHIEEPGLEDVIKRVVANGKFRATLTPERADVFLIAVPTPNLNDTYKSCDLKYVISAVNNMLPFLEKGNVVIVESTIAARTMDDHVRPLIEAAGFTIGEDIYVVHCPERVLPGQILHELIHNNRIVGGLTPACAEAGAAVYETFVQGEIVRTDAKTAEMSKLMENTFRDVNINASMSSTRDQRLRCDRDGEHASTGKLASSGTGSGWSLSRSGSVLHRRKSPIACSHHSYGTTNERSDATIRCRTSSSSRRFACPSKNRRLWCHV